MHNVYTILANLYGYGSSSRKERSKIRIQSEKLRQKTDNRGRPPEVFQDPLRKESVYQDRDDGFSQNPEISGLRS